MDDSYSDLSDLDISSDCSIHDISYELLFDIINHLDRKQKLRCQRTSKLFYHVAHASFDRHCIPFSWTNVNNGIFGNVNSRLFQRLAVLHAGNIHGSVLFKGVNEMRIFTPIDEFHIARFVREHQNIRKLIFFSVAFWERIIRHMNWFQSENLESITFARSSFYLATEIGYSGYWDWNHDFLEWEVPVSYSTATIDTDTRTAVKAMRRMVRDVIRNLFDHQEEELVKWYKDCLTTIDRELPSTKSVLWGILRSNVPSLKLSYFLIQDLARISVLKIPLRYLAFILKYLQTTANDKLPDTRLSMAGTMRCFRQD